MRTSAPSSSRMFVETLEAMNVSTSSSTSRRSIRAFLRRMAILVFRVMTNRAQEVRLPQPDATVDEERVVDQTRGLGHGQRSRVGEPVAGPDHERIESVLGPEGPRRTRV